MYAASSRVWRARASELSDFTYASCSYAGVSNVLVLPVVARLTSLTATIFDINDLKAIIDSPVNVPLGNISLCIQSQRSYSARL
jgi:hypothetical protein